MTRGLDDMVRARVKRRSTQLADLLVVMHRHSVAAPVYGGVRHYVVVGWLLDGVGHETWCGFNGARQPGAWDEPASDHRTVTCLNCRKRLDQGWPPRNPWGRIGHCPRQADQGWIDELARDMVWATTVTSLVAMADYSDLPRSVTLPPPPPNPSEVVRMSIEQMRATMTARFGGDPSRWAFVCPDCATVQCAADLEPLGPAAKANIGRVCVNRFRAHDDDRFCGFTALTSRGGPMSVTQRTDAGDTMRPSMMIADAPGGDGG